MDIIEVVTLYVYGIMTLGSRTSNEVAPLQSNLATTMVAEKENAVVAQLITVTTALLQPGSRGSVLLGHLSTKIGLWLIAYFQWHKHQLLA